MGQRSFFFKCLSGCSGILVVAALGFFSYCMQTLSYSGSSSLTRDRTVCFALGVWVLCPWPLGSSERRGFDETGARGELRWVASFFWVPLFVSWQVWLVIKEDGHIWSAAGTSAFVLVSITYEDDCLILKYSMDYWFLRPNCILCKQAPCTAGALFGLGPCQDSFPFRLSCLHLANTLYSRWWLGKINI